MVLVMLPMRNRSSPRIGSPVARLASAGGGDAVSGRFDEHERRHGDQSPAAARLDRFRSASSIATPRSMPLTER